MLRAQLDRPAERWQQHIDSIITRRRSDRIQSPYRPMLLSVRLMLQLHRRVIESRDTPLRTAMWRFGSIGNERALNTAVQQTDENRVIASSYTFPTKRVKQESTYADRNQRLVGSHVEGCTAMDKGRGKNIDRSALCGAHRTVLLTASSRSAPSRSNVKETSCRTGR